MSIIANRFKGVRAFLCTSTSMGRMTRAHNDSNVFCLGGKIAGEFEALGILAVWLTTDYEGGRHDISLGLIGVTENELGCDLMKASPTCNRRKPQISVNYLTITGNCRTM